MFYSAAIRYFTLFIVGLLISSCESFISADKPCGSSKPTSELPWLKNIISKADSDKVYKVYKGNYIGAIYLEKFNNQYVFYSTMTMYSGGVYFHVFYCDGTLVNFVNNQTTLSFLNNLKKDKLIYSNEP
jgi:hypothetical protein